MSRNIILIALLGLLFVSKAVAQSVKVTIIKIKEPFDCGCFCRFF